MKNCDSISRHVWDNCCVLLKNSVIFLCFIWHLCKDVVSAYKVNLFHYPTYLFHHKLFEQFVITSTNNSVCVQFEIDLYAVRPYKMCNTQSAVSLSRKTKQRCSTQQFHSWTHFFSSVHLGIEPPLFILGIIHVEWHLISGGFPPVSLTYTCESNHKPAWHSISEKKKVINGKPSIYHHCHCKPNVLLCRCRSGFFICDWWFI